MINDDFIKNDLFGVTMMVNSREILISSFLTRPMSAVSSVCRKCAPRKRCDDDDEDDEDDDEDDEVMVMMTRTTTMTMIG